MLETEIKLYAFALGYGRLLLADIDDARLAEQPAPGMNSPAWVIGHLALVADMGVGLLGGTPTLSDDWRGRHGPGSVPNADRAAYPSKSVLVEAWEQGHHRLTQAARNAAPERLQAPHGLPIAFLSALPSVGDLLAHILTTHEAAHLGQLSAWRRVLGYPGVLQL